MKTWRPMRDRASARKAYQALIEDEACAENARTRAHRALAAGFLALDAQQQDDPAYFD